MGAKPMISENNHSFSWYLRTQVTEPWAFVKDVFTEKQCRDIVDTVMLREPRRPAKISDGTVEIQLGIRSNDVCWMDSSDREYESVFRRVTDTINSINQQFWDFDLDYIESLQFSIYDKVGDHYIDHMDMQYKGVHIRKLGFSIQLSPEWDYDGCDLEIYNGTTFQPTARTQGTMIVFPSYALHRVTQLTRGQRYSLVGWVCGPKFR